MFRQMRLAGAVLVLAVFAQGAIAQPNDVTVVRHAAVSYGDLNLSSPAGQSTLHARVEAAAATACGGSPEFDSLYQDAPQYVRADFEKCRAKAERSAFREINDSNGRATSSR